MHNNKLEPYRGVPDSEGSLAASSGEDPRGVHVKTYCEHLALSVGATEPPRSGELPATAHTSAAYNCHRFGRNHCWPVVLDIPQLHSLVHGASREHAFNQGAAA